MHKVHLHVCRLVLHLTARFTIDVARLLNFEMKLSSLGFSQGDVPPSWR